MAVKNAIKAIPLSTIDSRDTSEDFYLALNPGGLPQACFEIRITNDSTGDYFVSFDGMNNQEAIRSLSVSTFSFQTNAQPNTNIANIPKGTVVYVKGRDSVGAIHLSGYYQQQM